MLEKITAGWPFAVVVLRSNLPLVVETYAPAAFCFDTGDGFAFVEPGYADPHGSGQHYFHRIVAVLMPTEAGVYFEGPEWSGRVEQYVPTTDQLTRIGECLEWFESLNLDLEAEHQRLRKMLSVDLG